MPRGQQRLKRCTDWRGVPSAMRATAAPLAHRECGTLICVFLTLLWLITRWAVRRRQGLEIVNCRTDSWESGMTEVEWLACNDPKPKLDFLKRKASDRKLRLFACACCRQFREQLKFKAFAEAVETSERFADTAKTKAALKRARQAVKTIRHGILGEDKARVVEWVALWLAEVTASENAFCSVGDEVIRLTSLGLIGPEIQSSLSRVMHCLCGPDSGPPRRANSAWLTQHLSA